MGPKLLFLLGIVLAHGALAAVWVRQDAPQSPRDTRHLHQRPRAHAVLSAASVSCWRTWSKFTNEDFAQP